MIQGRKIGRDKAGSRIGSGDGDTAGAAPRRAPARAVALAAACSVALAACTTPPPGLAPGVAMAGVPALAPDEALWAGAQPMAPAQLLQAMRQADVVLLGELHDNPRHHQRRGELLAALHGSRAVVVAEHLTAGRQVTPGARGAALLPALQAAGFDARGWDWPLHAPLFETVQAAGLPLLGGNLPREQVRQVAREGEAAWPEALRPLLLAAPLAPDAQARLDQELLDSHCGHLPASRVPAMRAAQRLRDAAMAQALLQAHAGGARPAVLLAGNGHVRRDLGVPQLLAQAAPGLRVLAVAFADATPAADAGAPYTHRWHTPAPSRGDPCAAMRR